MNLFPLQSTSNVWRVGLFILAVFASIIVGISYLVYDSPFSPLTVIGIILGGLIALFWIRSPAFVLYTCVLIVLLPIGLLPPSVHSNLNRFLTVAALIVWGIVAIVNRHRIVWTGTALFMVIFLTWCLLTMLWAQDLTVARNVLGGYTLRFVLFFFLFANVINTRENLNGLMHTLAVAGWVYVVAGISTVLIRGYEIGSRLQIFEDNQNALGGLFPLFAVSIIWLAIRTPNSRRTLWILLSLIFMLLSFILVGLSGSRGGAISWLITTLTLLFWRRTRLWGLVGLLICLTAIIIAPFVLSTTIDRFTDRARDTFLGGREALWQAAWLLIRDHPLRGVGAGNGPYAMMAYIRMFRSTIGIESAVIHNPLLTIWVETGLPGLLLYSGVFLSAVLSFFRQYSRCSRLDIHWLLPFFSLVASGFLGFAASWIKGGGMELGHSYFLMLALMLVPSNLELSGSPPRFGCRSLDKRRWSTNEFS